MLNRILCIGACAVLAACQNVEVVPENGHDAVPVGIHLKSKNKYLPEIETHQTFMPDGSINPDAMLNWFIPF